MFPLSVTSWTSVCGPVLNLGSVVQIAAGGAHTCALKVNGAVFCWGANGSGQVGDGTTVDRLRSVAVPSFTLNIDPRVELPDKGRKAIVTIIALGFGRNRWMICA